jgi:hypothetical protein
MIGHCCRCTLGLVPCAPSSTLRGATVFRYGTSLGGKVDTCRHFCSVLRVNYSSGDVGLHKVDPTDLEQFERTFGYTWLTHLKLLEEDSIFRQQVSEMKFSRRLRRTNYMRQIVDGARSIDTRVGSQGEDSQEFLDELEWLSAQEEVMDGQRITKHSDGIRVILAGQELKISPLWISVLVDDNMTTAKVYESVVPIEEEVIDKLDNTMDPFFESENLKFDDMAEFTSGPWRNYFIGVVGEVSVEEDGNLWPNQVLHKDRCLYNVRNASDLVKFLADPNEEDIKSHLSNLERLARERNYKRGWCWYMLKSRWGEQALAKFGITDSLVMAASRE